MDPGDVHEMDISHNPEMKQTNDQPLVYDEPCILHIDAEISKAEEEIAQLHVIDSPSLLESDRSSLTRSEWEQITVTDGGPSNSEQDFLQSSNDQKPNDDDAEFVYINSGKQTESLNWQNDDVKLPFEQFKLSQLKMSQKMDALEQKLDQEYFDDIQRKQTKHIMKYIEASEAERMRQENRHQEELQMLEEKYRREIQKIKKKLWCWMCEKEAISYCCWNTAYCTVGCQQAHWPTHRNACRRKKKQAQSAEGGQQQNSNTGGPAMEQ